MNISPQIKFSLTFGIVFFTFPLIINALGGYTWEANVTDSFTFARLITAIILAVLGYKFYERKQKP